MLEMARRRREGRDLAFAMLLAVGAAAGAWSLASRRQRKQASRLHRVLIELLLKTLTAGDPETARHSRRVANLADALAEPLRLDREAHATLRIAALLHDVGKMDDELFEVVHSPSPLTEEERDRIHRHPRTSADILAPLEPFHPGLIETVRAHHECWNGGGYPEGLAGEDVPLSARVIAVADVFDALTQPRSYREPLDPEDAISRIVAGAGTRFDPRIIALLDDRRVASRWKDIVERGREEESADAAAP